MGQYYTPITQKGDDEKTRQTYSLSYNGEFYGHKLTEHSWWYNPVMNAFVSLFQHNPLRLAWVGDYSRDVKLCKENNLYEFIVRNRKNELALKGELSMKGLFLVNHSKKVYLDCNDYYTRCQHDGWCLHPLSLLTAVGNGNGGGDYYGENADDVGAWAWDIISVENEPPAGFNEVKYSFVETW